MIGSAFIAFSKEKIEDEIFQQLRFESLVWALKVQSLLAILLLCKIDFLQFMMIALIMFHVLCIERYHYPLIKPKKSRRMRNSLREIRMSASLSRQAFAAKTGVSRQRIHPTKKGKYVPFTKLGLKMRRVLHKKVEDIFTLD